MAKPTYPPGTSPVVFVVILNGAETSPWEVEAATAEEAIDKIVAQTGTLRDKRNFRAYPKGKD